MSIPLFEQLREEGLISPLSFEKIEIENRSRLFSVHWELRTILYLGILMLTSGLGILVYKNLDTIGHQVILISIAVLCAGCFFYCEKNKLPFSRAKVSATNAWFDYVLLLGCLTLLTFIAYLQAEYTAFGNAYGLATFIPMVILFFCAYYFDHLGVLSMAITNLAAWAGIAVTPLTILKENNFGDARLIFTGLALGVLLVVIATASERKNMKAHFAFTYLNFALNILFIAAIAGMFHFDNLYVLWVLPVAAIAYYFYTKALALSSFYFIMMISLYGYLVISYVLMRGLLTIAPEAYTLGLLYFIGSGVYMIIFLTGMNKKLKRHDSV